MLRSPGRSREAGLSGTGGGGSEDRVSQLEFAIDAFQRLQPYQFQELCRHTNLTILRRANAANPPRQVQVTPDTTFELSGFSASVCHHFVKLARPSAVLLFGLLETRFDQIRYRARRPQIRRSVATRGLAKAKLDQNPATTNERMGQRLVGRRFGGNPVEHRG